LRVQFKLNAFGGTMREELKGRAPRGANFVIPSREDGEESWRGASIRPPRFLAVFAARNDRRRPYDLLAMTSV
jgi:hypothetical protein